MAPKKKSQKIALTDFLMDDNLGSWADEMDSLPSAPAPRADGERGEDGDFMSRPNRGDFSGPPREELPLPTQAPWTAFVGNLAFDVGEGEVSSFFTGLKLVSVKIINDMEGKPKGFGYVEFGTLDMLKEGLGRSGEQLAGRAVRVSVAEPPKGAGSRLGGSRDAYSASAAAAEEKSSWRREGPLPPVESSSANGPRQSSYNNSPSVPEAERDWGAARGSKFVPSVEPVRTPGGGPPRTGGFVSESGAAAEAASQWRSNKPVATGPVEREAPPHQRAGLGAPGGFRPAAEGPMSPADTEDQWTRGGRFVPTVERSAPSSRRGSHEFQSRGGSPFPPSGAPADESPSDWRSNMRKGSSGPGSSAERSPIPSATSSPQPASRRPLTLLPRTTSSTGTGGVPTPAPSNPTSPSASTPPSPALSNTASLATTTHKPSPFGAARAVDNAAREKEVEEKIAKQEAESKERRQKEKEARELKAKTFVRAPPVGGGDRRGNNNNNNNNKPTSPPPAGAGVEAPTVVVGGEGEGEEKKVVAEEVVTSPKKANVTLGAPVVEKKSFAAAPSFAALEVEGGEEDEDEDVEEVTEKVAKVEV
ncbi:hypothetical protein BDY24DRAFT_368240 [Mrakia frigida]|uniref:Tif3p n=1 Tax=Mrakia frigida TaxID=29902 RepID=UPI003FCC1B8F